MLKECIKVFEKILKEKGDSLILDSYIPIDGTYVIVDLENNKVKHYIIKKDDEKGIIDKSIEDFSKICHYDYYSKIINTNKAIADKKIHSNNYLSFFAKKENIIKGEITEKIIDDYYAILTNPLLKYSKKNKSKNKSKNLYEAIEKEVGKVDGEYLERCKEWIKNNIFNIQIENSKEEYLKIFFKAPIEKYKNESKRYLIPNIFNNNDFNVNFGEKVYGLPKDNMNLNAKKPYLENKSRKFSVPYLANLEEVLLQKKFFDYLMNLASVGKVNVYINDETIVGKLNGELPTENFTGMLLRLKKGKTEVEVNNFDIVTNYRYDLLKPFKFEKILDVPMNKYSYSTFNTISDIQELINEIFFSEYLVKNYFTDSNKMSIKDNRLIKNLLLSRKVIFNWLYKGAKDGLYNILDKITLDLVKNSIFNKDIFKAKHQFNLRYSLLNYLKEDEFMNGNVKKIENSMREKINSEKNNGQILNDQEYSYSIGQVVNYFLGRYRGNNKNDIFIHPFLHSKGDKDIKLKLRRLYDKYKHDIPSDAIRFKRYYYMILDYTLDKKIDQDMLIAGYIGDNLIDEKKEEK